MTVLSNEELDKLDGIPTDKKYENDRVIMTTDRKLNKLIADKVAEAVNGTIHKLNPYLNNNLSVEGQIMMTKTLDQLQHPTKPESEE